jgi:hypothetical protein
MSEPIHIISLGAGVQSSAMALMASECQIQPMPVALDKVIFNPSKEKQDDLFNNECEGICGV